MSTFRDQLVEKLHDSHCRVPGCLARQNERDQADIMVKLLQETVVPALVAARASEIVTGWGYEAAIGADVTAEYVIAALGLEATS